MIAIAYVALMQRLTKSSITRKIKPFPYPQRIWNLNLSQHSSYSKNVGFPRSYFHFLKRHILVHIRNYQRPYHLLEFG